MECCRFNTTGKSPVRLSSLEIRNISLYRNSDLRYLSASPRLHKGTLARSSRNVGAGCDGRCGVSAVQTARTKTSAAYGEVVWSWRRDPGVKPMERSIGDGGKKGRSPGRARSKP